jgi:hypothetical protein
MVFIFMMSIEFTSEYEFGFDLIWLCPLLSRHGRKLEKFRPAAKIADHFDDGALAPLLGSLELGAV